MTSAELIAEHGSPLWLCDVERVRANLRAIPPRMAGARGRDTAVAYSYKTNRLPGFLRALAD